MLLTPGPRDADLGSGSVRLGGGSGGLVIELFRLRGAEAVERASYTQASAVQDMQVNHRRPDIAVTQQCLNRADIVSILQKVCREAVPMVWELAGLAVSDSLTAFLMAFWNADSCM